MKQNNYKLSDSGIKLLITAGIHGDQHSSILLAERLCQLISKHQINLDGIQEVTILNFINEFGIYNFTRQNQNGIDLNREFSKKKSLQTIVEDIKKKIKQNDVIIDLHSSRNSTQFFYLNNDSLVQSYLQFLDGLKIPYVVSNVRTNTIKTYSNKLGKIGFTFQMNQNGQTLDNVSVIKAIMIFKKLLSNLKSFKQFKSDFTPTESQNLLADINGRLKICTKLGKIVQQNQLLGYILGEKTKINIYSPSKAIIIAFPSVQKYIKEGIPIIGIQPIF